MFNISSYLNKFKQLYAENLYFKDEVVRTIKGVSGIEVSKENITYKNGILTLNIRPIQKNELFLKKMKILSKLNEAFPNKISDIR